MEGRSRGAGLGFLVTAQPECPFYVRLDVIILVIMLVIIDYNVA